MNINTVALDPMYPRVWVDFNACGWAIEEEPEDSCYYVYFEEDFQKLSPIDGMILCIYMDDDEVSVVGCLARLERYRDSWRFRKIDDSWFEISKELFALSSVPGKDRGI